MRPELRLATPGDIGILVSLVGAYHEFEGIDPVPEARAGAIMPLLERDDLGRIWLVLLDDVVVGYIALGFGYSIEFGGRDAFVDEFFLEESVRGRGIGRAVLRDVAAEAREFSIRALHLEVAKGNARAIRLYTAAGFEPRAKYRLMTLQLKPA